MGFVVMRKYKKRNRIGKRVLLTHDNRICSFFKNDKGDVITKKIIIIQSEKYINKKFVNTLILFILVKKLNNNDKIRA